MLHEELKTEMKPHEITCHTLVQVILNWCVATHHCVTNQLEVCHDVHIEMVCR